MKQAAPAAKQYRGRERDWISLLAIIRNRCQSFSAERAHMSEWIFDVFAGAGAERFTQNPVTDIRVIPVRTDVAGQLVTSNVALEIAGRIFRRGGIIERRRIRRHERKT